MPSKFKIEKVATDLLTELFGEIEDPEIEVHQTEEIEIQTASTFAQSLQQKIDKKTTPKISEVVPTKKSLKSEMNLFEATNGQQKGENLQKLFLVLKNIAPTSIASEQAFSISSDFIRKKRSLLSDQAIDDLCFEKGYFANEGLSYT